MSDSHDNLTLIDAAIRLFNEQEVEFVFHAGDICSPFAVKKLFFFDGGPLRAVFGNNDGEKEGIRNLFNQQDNAQIATYSLVETLADKRIIMQHGHIPFFLEALVQNQQYDLVITGHTHKTEIRTINRTLVVNPGTTAGYLAINATIIILETDTKSTQLVELE